jgi:hypothetical protein
MESLPRRSRRKVFGAVLGAFLIGTMLLQSALHSGGKSALLQTVGQSEPARQAQAARFLSRAPLHFERNQGQVDGQVRFLTRGSG